MSGRLLIRCLGRSSLSPHTVAIGPDLSELRPGLIQLLLEQLHLLLILTILTVTATATTAVARRDSRRLPRSLLGLTLCRLQLHLESVQVLLKYSLF